MFETVNLALVVIGTFIFTIAMVQVFNIVRSSKKDNETYQETIQNSWDRIRPIVNELVIELIKLNASKNSFDSVLTYSVRYIKERVDSSEWLLQNEKDILSDSLIKAMIEPYLRNLYEKKYFTQG